ncbi:MAG: hypothetical protein AAFX92_15990 [Pseudomonadota bacterium]
MGRTALAIVAAFVISMAGNTAYYTATAEGHRLPFTSDEPLFALLVLSHLVMAIFTLAAIAWSSAARHVTWQTGALIGGFLGVVMFLPIGLIVRAAWDVPVTVYFGANIVVAVVINAAMGAVIAAIARLDGPRRSAA